MFRSWKIGSAFGIPIYIHTTFLLVPLLAIWTSNVSGLVPVLAVIGLILALFACVVLHEFGHALTARYFGIETRDVTLYPIGGVARLERMSEKPWEELLIAIAGPAVNVVIALLLAPVAFYAIWTGAFHGDLHQLSLDDGLWPVAAELIVGLFSLNVGLVLFNLLPAFPMDGGRVLRALLNSWLGFPRATEIAAKVGVVVAFCIGAWGLFPPTNFFLPVLAAFVVMAGQNELLAVRRREAYRAMQHQMAAFQLPIVMGIPEPPPVARAIEIQTQSTVKPANSAEPPFLFQFRVIEIPEAPQ